MFSTHRLGGIKLISDDAHFLIAAHESYTKCMFFHKKFSEGVNVSVQGFGVENLMHGEIWRQSN
jgi:D-serine dehydratase